MSPSILWFRRDLRLGDHPALCRAAESGQVLPLFVFDPRLLSGSQVRAARLVASVHALAEATGGALVVRHGPPETIVPELARDAGASAVHVTRETTPFGRRRDDAVARSLNRHGIPLVATGTPYAVGPGSVVTGSGAGYQVFTPFSKAWRAHGWPAPAPLPAKLSWADGIPSDEWPSPRAGLPTAETGETAALERWQAFLRDGLAGYDADRNRPDLDATSRLSIALKYGEIHPRTLLAGLAEPERTVRREGSGARRFVTELCWREFYADVVWHRPDSAWGDLRADLRGIRYDDPSRYPAVAEAVERWRQGRTGYPMVDAGMRQLLAEGWMHNRVRMVTASFLVKDLHVWWPLGARHFLDHLLDGDLASNNHGWQWTAGTGTDPAPYFRIFNPVSQGLRFDPAGDYVRRWVPELAHLPGASAHEPWKHPEGYAADYPTRLVDHDVEREESLARYAAARAEAS